MIKTYHNEISLLMVKPVRKVNEMKNRSNTIISSGSRISSLALLVSIIWTVEPANAFPIYTFTYNDITETPSVSVALQGQEDPNHIIGTPSCTSLPNVTEECTAEINIPIINGTPAALFWTSIGTVPQFGLASHGGTPGTVQLGELGADGILSDTATVGTLQTAVSLQIIFRSYVEDASCAINDPNDPTCRVKETGDAQDVIRLYFAQLDANLQPVGGVDAQGVPLQPVLEDVIRIQSDIPEPATLPLFGIGTFGLLGCMWLSNRKRNSAAEITR